MLPRLVHSLCNVLTRSGPTGMAHLHGDLTLLPHKESERPLQLLTDRLQLLPAPLTSTPTSTHHLPNFPCTGLKMDISFQPDSWFDTKGRVSVGLQTGSLNLNPTLTLTYHLLSLNEDRPFEWQMMVPFFCPMISPVSCYCKVSTVHPPSQFVLQTETEFSYIFKENSTWKCCQERGLVFSPPH